MSYEFLKNASVLITGGTGSFGQNCVRRLLSETQARRIIVFSRDEFKQLRMQSAIFDPEQKLRFFIGDIRDAGRLQRAFRGVDYVIHAAALKQVPALEYNPFEAVKTNILGTQYVINAALDQGVKKVVMLSSDKAANPANLYGATKLCAEKLTVSGNAYSGGTTEFSAVRYGNVISSRGSILEIINEQRSSGSITLTHEEMTRFWITLDQAFDLVMLAFEKMHGGEIFVPKIPSAKVKNVIQVVAPECDIRVIGIRTGEKMHEILLTSEEAQHAREFDDYYVIIPQHEWWDRSQHGGGSSVGMGFFYSSEHNKDQLDSDSLKKLLDLL